MCPLVLAALLAAAPSVHGRVVDARTSAPIVDARVTLQIEHDGSGARTAARAIQTDSQGGFTFSDVAPGRYVLTVSTVGYIFFDRAIAVTLDAPIDLIIALSEGAGTYREQVDVAATGGAARDAGAHLALGSAALQDVRGVATDDPLRAVHTLPGVVAGEDFQADFSVRGALFRQIGVVVDGMPVRTLMHAVQGVENSGSISMISTDVLERATLTPGVHARTAGDWLGATLAFDMREGSRDRASIRGAISGTSASAVVEGPLTQSKRGSVLVAVRRSYLDWLIRQIDSEFDSTVGFWDGQFKLVFDATPTQQLQLTVIGGDASYQQSSIVSDSAVSRATSGNTVAQLAWRSTGRNWLATQRVMFSGSDYRNTGATGDLQSRGYAQSLSWRSDLLVSAGNGWTIEGGGVHERVRSAERHHFDDQAFEIRPHEHITSVWGQGTWRGSSTTIALGVRASRHAILDAQYPIRDVTNSATAPWVMAERRIGAWTWRAAAGGSSQFPNALFGYRRPEPAPERAWSVDGEVERQLSRSLSWSATALHRRESHVSWESYEPRLCAPMCGVDFGEPGYSATLRGRSRGIDVVLTRRPGAGLSGWAAYTWAKTTMRDEVTREAFAGDADQRHTMNAVGTLRLSYRMNVGAKLRIGSGVPLYGYFQKQGEGLRLAPERNRVRLPVYARLDLRAARTFAPGRRRVTLFVEMLNVLGRENIGRAAPRASFNGNVTNFGERMVPRVPSAGLLIEF